MRQKGDSGILVSQPSPFGKGDRAAVDRMLSQTAYLRRFSPIFFIPLPPSNLRPFGAPPSIGRRECPRREGFVSEIVPSSFPSPSPIGIASPYAQ